jgi:cellulose synthase/poly-beta-1,6-N-acetylglucosamine synthase-like glycosyltransferase
VIILLIIISLLAVHYAACAVSINKAIKRIKNDEQDAAPDEFVSVIIPFRNESDNIIQSLESMKVQDYPTEKYEVIYVNDKSDDDSFKKIEDAEKPDNIKVISVPEDYLFDASKIRAVKFGIDNSKGKIIVLTDCDCIHNKTWLNSILNCFDQQTGFVAGPVDFIEENTVFKKVQKLEFAGLILTGAGLIGIDKPIICNSANLAFRKDLYDMLGGFKVESKLSSSADEFLMLEIQKKSNYKIKFCWNKDSIAFSKPTNSVIEFYNQRKRWASKEWLRYGGRILFQLILVYLFFICLIVQTFLGIFISQIFFYSLLISIAFKVISEYQILKNGIGFFYEKKIFHVFPLAEILHIPYILFGGISGLFGKFIWKNRKLNR